MGEIKAKLADTSPSRLLIVGNPRVAQMSSPPSPAQLQALGLDAARPFVLWMPTFRVAQDGGGRIAWSNTANPGSDRALAEVAAAIAEQLELAGITLVVKPHMFDATARDVPGAVILDNDTLMRHGVPLYGLLGASAGLISDYSSVWIDYLAADRPIGFLVNDLDDFRHGRGIAAPELINQYPGERLDSPEGIARFIGDISAAGALGRTSRKQFMDTIGYKASVSSADEVVRVALKI
jgi:CDP-glycerol glycerophosphotransferase (TagB/SpsB family)